MNYWSNFNDKADIFTQCPNTILESNIHGQILKLYLILWKEAFSNKYKYKGITCAKITQKELASKLKWSTKHIKRGIEVLMNKKLIVRKKIGRDNIYLFTRKNEWII